MHDLVDRGACKFFGLALQMPDEELDDLRQRDAAPPDRRLLVHQRGAEDRLQRAHQPPVMLLDIGVDRPRP